MGVERSAVGGIWDSSRRLRHIIGFFKGRQRARDAYMYACMRREREDTVVR